MDVMDSACHQLIMLTQYILFKVHPAKKALMAGDVRTDSICRARSKALDAAQIASHQQSPVGHQVLMAVLHGPNKLLQAAKM